MDEKEPEPKKSSEKQPKNAKLDNYKPLGTDFSIDKPADGTTNYDISGGASGKPIGTTPAKQMAKQISGGNLTMFATFDASQWNVPIKPTECPYPNAWYVLSIYAWDAQGNCTRKSVSFQRGA